MLVEQRNLNGETSRRSSRLFTLLRDEPEVFAAAVAAAHEIDANAVVSLSAVEGHVQMMLFAVYKTKHKSKSFTVFCLNESL